VSERRLSGVAQRERGALGERLRFAGARPSRDSVAISGTCADRQSPFRGRGNLRLARLKSSARPRSTSVSSAHDSRLSSPSCFERTPLVVGRRLQCPSRAPKGPPPRVRDGARRFPRRSHARARRRRRSKRRRRRASAALASLHARGMVRRFHLVARRPMRPRPRYRLERGSWAMAPTPRERYLPALCRARPRSTAH
jgi:hypothetical protein